MQVEGNRLRRAILGMHEQHTPTTSENIDKDLGRSGATSSKKQQALYAELDKLEKQLTEKREAIEDIKAYVAKLWKPPAEGPEGGSASAEQTKRNLEWNSRLETVSLAEISNLEKVIDELEARRNEVRRKYWEAYYDLDWSNVNVPKRSTATRAYANASPATAAAAESLTFFSLTRPNEVKTGAGHRLHHTAALLWKQNR